MQDELKPWTEDHLKSALVNLIEASKNSVRGPERSGSEQAASGIFKQIVAAWNARAPSVPAGCVAVERSALQLLFEGYCRKEPSPMKFAMMVQPESWPRSMDARFTLTAWEAVHDALYPAAAPKVPT